MCACLHMSLLPCTMSKSFNNQVNAINTAVDVHATTGVASSGRSKVVNAIIQRSPYAFQEVSQPVHGKRPPG